MSVIADIVDSNQSSYTLYCNDKEYTSMEYGDRIFQVVAQDILALRTTITLYPIHITDIEFSRLNIDKDHNDYMQTIYFMNYKRVIEEKLNQAVIELNDQANHQAQG